MPAVQFCCRSRINLSSAKHKMNNGKLYTLFIVEEGDAYTFLLRSKLQKSPEFKVLHYRTGDDVIQNLSQNPAMVIIDDKLPGLNGISILQALKKHFQKIPVIILSTPDNSSDFLSYMRDGIYDYLIKESDSATMADKLIRRIVKTVKQKENKDTDLQQMRILLAIVILILIIVAVFWFIY
jgi:DNA-binding NtrC family response regulator